MPATSDCGTTVTGCGRHQLERLAGGRGGRRRFELLLFELRTGRRGLEPGGSGLVRAHGVAPPPWFWAYSCSMLLDHVLERLVARRLDEVDDRVRDVRLVLLDEIVEGLGVVRAEPVLGGEALEHRVVQQQPPDLVAVLVQRNDDVLRQDVRVRVQQLHVGRDRAVVREHVGEELRLVHEHDGRLADPDRQVVVEWLLGRRRREALLEEQLGNHRDDRVALELVLDDVVPVGHVRRDAQVVGGGVRRADVGRGDQHALARVVGIVVRQLVPAGVVLDEVEELRDVERVVRALVLGDARRPRGSSRSACQLAMTIGV